MYNAAGVHLIQKYAKAQGISINPEDSFGLG